MILPLALWLALAGARGCSKPVALTPAGNFIVPGSRADIPYHSPYSSTRMLDAYAPPGPARPYAVLIHGHSGNRHTHLTQLFELLTRAGYAWFSVDYQAPADLDEALNYIQCAGRFNISGEPLLIGEDTGAALALQLAARYKTQGVVAFGTALQGFPPGTATKLAALRELPVLMFHGTADDEAPPAAAQALCRRLPGCRFVSVPGAIHNFENWHPDQWAWKEEFTHWLRDDQRGLWKDITYARPGGRPLLMDADIPSGPGLFPAVIIVHGGGWEAGDKVTYVSPVFAPLARAQMAWFSIDYRLTPYVRVPEQLEDVRAAIRFVREHAAWFHVDPERIALLGESASGQLVTQVASEPCPDCAVKAVVSFYGVYDFTRWAKSPGEQPMLERLFGPWTPATLERYSPAFHARRDLPPLLLFQGTADELASQATEYAERLKKAGANFELVMVHGAPHGMENWEGHPEWAFYKQRLVEWLRLKLGRPALEPLSPRH